MTIPKTAAKETSESLNTVIDLSRKIFPTATAIGIYSKLRKIHFFFVSDCSGFVRHCNYPDSNDLLIT